MQTENVLELDELELDGKFDQPIVLGVQGPPGPQGNHGKPGADGEDGGYYTPAVTQLDEDTIQFNFTPSKEGMPAVAPVTVELPVGQGSGGNAENGEDGFSPIAKVEQTASGAVISITDKDGTTTATITNGKDGVDGQPGKDGADGAPGEKGEKGDKGDPGEPGQKGEQGIQGIPGEKGDKGDTGAPGAKGDKGDTGEKGDPGKDGVNGVTPHVGSNGNWFIGDNDTGIPATGPAGGQGLPGTPGEDGKDGTSATHSWNGTVLTITSASGTSSADLKGAKGDKGDTGAQGIQGIQGEPGAKGDKGDKGDTGATGATGSNGKDGTSVTVKSVSESTADGGSNVVTFSDGKTLTVKNGKTGAAGKDGADGFPGADGYTPQRGKDYWTPDDIAAMDAKLAQMLADRAQLRPEPAESLEWLKANGDTSKLYVLMDKTSAHYGYIYGWFMTEVESGPAYTNLLPLAINADKTPYVGNNGEKGYKTGWRLNSSAVEKEQDGTCMTGFIPVKNGDTIRIKNVSVTVGSSGYFHWYRSDFTLCGSAYYENYNTDAYNTKPDANGVITFNAPTVPAGDTAYGGLTYFRMSTGVISDATIVTVNEEITEGGSVTTEYAWANTGIAFVSTDYGPRVASLEKQTAQNTADIANLKNGVASATPIKDWDSPIYDANIPVFQLSAEKAAMTNATMTPDALYAMYDALMAKYPHYITKTDLGICSDGVNHVYRYDFKDPEQRCFHNRKSETKAKAIIVSGIHLEWAGMFGLYYALEEIAENSALRDLRRNVHLIVIPCSNPYTTLVEHYEAHGGQQNANGVEVHRNFEVDFLYPDDSGYVAEGELHHGGTEPLSEVETQYIDNVLKENTDAALFMTCHNFNLDSYYGISFIWPSVATKYMCNMGYRLIDKMSDAWMDKYGDEFAPGIASYRTDLLESWDTRLGYAQISGSPGTETKQATKYGIQAANVEICERFHVHGTKENPEPKLSSFTMSRGAEVYVNFLLTAFGVYDPKDKKEYAPTTV